MPLLEDIAKKAKEIQVHDALCAANSGNRMRLEQELAPIQKELAKQEGFLGLCQTQLKTTTVEVAKLKSAKPFDKTKFDAAEKKLKGLKEQEPKLRKLVEALKADAKGNSAAWEKLAAEVKVLGVKKNTLAAEMAALMAKKKEADVIDGYTFDTVIGNAAMLRDFGARTHNEEIAAFIINGPRGDKSTYVKFIQSDDINLNGARAVREAFRELAAKDQGGTKVDWSKAPWQDAYNYVIRDLKADTRHLDEYKKLLRAARHLT
jgi:hypothetical protein